MRSAHSTRTLNIQHKLLHTTTFKLLSDSAEAQHAQTVVTYLTEQHTEEPTQVAGSLVQHLVENTLPKYLLSPNRKTGIANYRESRTQ